MNFVQNIVPVTILQVEATLLQILVEDIKPNTSCVLNCYVSSTEGELTAVRKLPMQGQDYQNWTTDDNHIIEYALSALGLAAATPSPEV